MSANLAPSPDLSARELQVLLAIAHGKTNKEIAHGIELSPETVKKYRKNLMEKLGIATIAGLTVYAIKTGLLKVEGIEVSA